MTDPTGPELLAVPMPPGRGAGGKTLGEWLVMLLAQLWDEKSDFSAKRPQGYSIWWNDAYEALGRAGLIAMTLDGDGEVTYLDGEHGDILVADAVAEIDRLQRYAVAAPLWQEAAERWRGVARQYRIDNLALRARISDLEEDVEALRSAPDVAAVSAPGPLTQAEILALIDGPYDSPDGVEEDRSPFRDASAPAPVPREVSNPEPGVVQVTHAASVCRGWSCCVHNPSDHHMRDWPLVHRSDRATVVRGCTLTLSERTCPHGVGHPDPDSLAFLGLWSSDPAWGVHGCDGCCEPPGGWTRDE